MPSIQVTKKQKTINPTRDKLTELSVKYKNKYPLNHLTQFQFIPSDNQANGLIEYIREAFQWGCFLCLCTMCAFPKIVVHCPILTEMFNADNT